MQKKKRPGSPRSLKRERECIVNSGINSHNPNQFHFHAKILEKQNQSQ